MVHIFCNKSASEIWHVLLVSILLKQHTFLVHICGKYIKSKWRPMHCCPHFLTRYLTEMTCIIGPQFTETTNNTGPHFHRISWIKMTKISVEGSVIIGQCFLKQLSIISLTSLSYITEAYFTENLHYWSTFLANTLNQNNDLSSCIIGPNFPISCLTRMVCIIIEFINY